MERRAKVTDYDSVFAYHFVTAEHNATLDFEPKARAKRHTELASLENLFRSWHRQWILMQGILGEEVVVDDGQDVLDEHVHEVVVPGIAASGQVMQAPLLRLVVATSAAVPSKLRQPPVAAGHTGTVVTNRAARRWLSR